MSVIIESLDQEGRGIAHENGKVLFIEGALPGETVAYLSFKKKPAYELAQATQILKQSFLRATPRCKYFGVCGGCSMQHLDARAQVAAKQRVLEDTLWHIGKVRAKTVLPAIYGLAWGYRHRARLSVRYVQKKGGVLVGFHEKRNSFIVDMHSCEVLPEHISALIDPMRELIGNLSIRESIPQIELALGDAADVLLLRILESLSEADEQLLKDFSDQHNVQFYLQSKGPDTVYRFWPQNAPELNYGLPEFGIVMPFQPTEFTQVNPAVNRVMVRRAMRLLAPQVGERIADLFCGLGNFSLPIAKRGAMVVGIEGSLTLVERAQANAERNGLAERAEFLQANLFAATEDSLAQLGKFDKMLIDPPRDGAMDIVKALAAPFPERIVYVSCNPATLARDAEVLVHQKGYALKAAGVVNMFPHTGHIESMALFVRESDLSCA